MEYIYAALMLHSAGKDVTEDGISSIIDAAGIGVDDSRVKALVAALDGVDIESAIAQAAVTAPVAAPASPAAPSAPEAPEAAAEEAKEEKEKEEKKEEEAEESGMAGLGALFG